MTEIIEKYEEAFAKNGYRRTRQKTLCGGWKLSTLIVILRCSKLESISNVLVIVNTTECSKQVYEKIKSSCSDEDQVIFSPEQ